MPTLPTTVREAPGVRTRRAIVVVDLVESVRLMHEDEDGVVSRWIAFTSELRAGAMTRHGGRIVKSLGDGVLITFPGAAEATRAAGQLHRMIGRFNRGADSDSRLELRIGIHIAEILETEFDIYGAGVNLAARVATLARPRQTVVTADIHDELLPGLDLPTEDMGECFLKHLSEPVRAYRLLHRHPSARPGRPGPSEGIRPCVAVCPFDGDAGHAEASLLGGVLAHELVMDLANEPAVRVIAPLSTMRAAGRARDLASTRIATHLVRGKVMRHGGQGYVVTVEVVDARSAEVVWQRTQATTATAALHGPTRPSGEWAREIAASICFVQPSALRAAPVLPQMPSYALLLVAIVQMHRLSRPMFDQACSALDHLIDRHPSAAELRAWRAKCFMLQILQNWTDSPERSAERAYDQIRRAVDIEPTHAMASALKSHLQLLMGEDPGVVASDLRAVTSRQPNEPLGWLFLGNALSGLEGHEAESATACEQALALSPLDPLRYFFDTFAAAAFGALGRHELAFRHAQRSVRDNASHLAGLLQLIIAAGRAGRPGTARRAARRYLHFRPRATVSRYRELNAQLPDACLDAEAAALLAAGIPA